MLNTVLCLSPRLWDWQRSVFWSIVEHPVFLWFFSRSLIAKVPIWGSSVYILRRLLFFSFFNNSILYFILLKTSLLATLSVHGIFKILPKSYFWGKCYTHFWFDILFLWSNPHVVGLKANCLHCRQICIIMLHPIIVLPWNE